MTNVASADRNSTDRWPSAQQIENAPLNRPARRWRLSRGGR